MKIHPNQSYAEIIKEIINAVKERGYIQTLKGDPRRLKQNSSSSYSKNKKVRK